ncbi:MAG: nucleotide-binding protein [Candidatus Margulisiibacteriota bacterium]
MVFYHVRITQKSNKSHDEVKIDLSKGGLFAQFVEPYEKGIPIIINGKTIVPEDLERIRITETEKDSSFLLSIIERERQRSSVVVFGGPSDEWEVAHKGKDITDELIKGPPGYKKIEKTIEAKKSMKSDKIFVVHGHDQLLKNDIEIFIQNIGLEPIVLHRQPDEGFTIIEKLEKHTDVGYAFVLLTPDDIGFPVSELQKDEKERKIEYRARQNVIFEFGYLIGKLGRNRVCCIYKENTNLPTDISGLLYKKVISSIDDVGYSLIKELKAAGYEIKL